MFPVLEKGDQIVVSSGRTAGEAMTGFFVFAIPLDEEPVVDVGTGELG